MGLIKEPAGVDFVIKGKPLTIKQEKELSEFIAKRKLELKHLPKKKKDSLPLPKSPV
jgi:hypothetical protein